MTPPEGIGFPRPKPPARAGTLSRWIDNYAGQAGMATDRVRRHLAFELILAAFERSGDGDPPLVVKGGLAIELRLGLRARATKDVDAMLRRPAEPEAIEESVREALAPPLLDGMVTFDVRAARPIGPTGAMRFDVRVLWRGTALAKTTLEVSSDEGDAGRSWDAIPSLGIAAQLGIEGGPEEVPCLPLRFQIAQKLHAVSDPREENDRFRDLADLLMLDELDERDPDGVLRATCVALFEARRGHPWPPQVTVRPGWSDGYPALAETIGFPLAEVEAAAEAVQAMVDRIDGAGSAGAA